LDWVAALLAEEEVWGVGAGWGRAGGQVEWMIVGGEGLSKILFQDSRLRITLTDTEVGLSQ